MYVYILSRLLLHVLFCDTSVCGLKLLVYEALRYKCVRPCATSVCYDCMGLTILVYVALSY